MIVTSLWRPAGSPRAEASIALDDVDPNAFYGEAIRWAAGEGIVGGYGNGLFGPGNPVIREQTAAILYRCTQYQGGDVSVGENIDVRSYSDFDAISPCAVPAMQWACGMRLIRGVEGNLLSPGAESAGRRAPPC